MGTPAIGIPTIVQKIPTFSPISLDSPSYIEDIASAAIKPPIVAEIAPVPLIQLIVDYSLQEKCTLLEDKNIRSFNIGCTKPGEERLIIFLEDNQKIEFLIKDIDQNQLLFLKKAFIKCFNFQIENIASDQFANQLTQEITAFIQEADDSNTFISNVCVSFCLIETFAIEKGLKSVSESILSLSKNILNTTHKPSDYSSYSLTTGEGVLRLGGLSTYFCLTSESPALIHLLKKCYHIILTYPLQLAAKSDQNKQLLKNLLDWTNEKFGMHEYQSRVMATLEIYRTNLRQSYELPLLFGLGLTSLPSGLALCTHLNSIELRGNYLSLKDFKLLESLPSLFGKDIIQKEILDQQQAFKYPACASYLFRKKHSSNPPRGDAEKLASDLLEKKVEMHVPNHRTPILTALQNRFVSLELASIDTARFFRKNMKIMPAFFALSITLCAIGILLNPLAGSIALVTILSLYLAYIHREHIPNIFSFYKLLGGLYWHTSLRNLCTFNAMEGSLNDHFAINRLAKETCGKLHQQIPQEVLKNIEDAFEDAATFECFTEKAIEKIQKGELVILPLGFSAPFSAHIIHLVFYQNKMMICNRGASAYITRGDFATMVRLYEIDPSKINLQLLENLKDLCYKLGDDLGDTYLYEALPKALNGKLLRLPLAMRTIKWQKHDNCTIASAKVAFFGSAYLIQGGTEEAAVLAKKQKRLFSYKLRTDALKKAKSFSSLLFLGKKSRKQIQLAEEIIASYKERKVDGKDTAPYQRKDPTLIHPEMHQIFGG